MNTEPASFAVDAEVGFDILLRPPVIMTVSRLRQAMVLMRDKRPQQPLLAEITKTIDHTGEFIMLPETRDKQVEGQRIATRLMTQVE